MTTVSIEPVVERLLAGGHPSDADVRALFESRDLLGLGMAADEIRRRRHGSRISFVRVADIPIDRVLAGEVSWKGRPGELRITGAPGDLGQAVRAVKAVVATAGSIPVTAFSIGDVARAADSDRLATDWCAALKDAGLAAIAEAAVDDATASGGWLAAADGVSLPIARLTVSRASESGQGALLARAGELLTAHPPLDVFAPLPQQTTGIAPSTGYDDVRLVALARLLLPVAHIQVDWRRYGPKLAQVALTFGADDVDGVLPDDEVAEGRRRSPLEEIRRNIIAASGEPVERGALFSPRR